MEQLQNVVEDLEQTRLRGRTAAADGQVRQDKLFKQSETRLRGNRLPTAASSHSDTPENWILPDAVAAAENPASWRLSSNFGGLENPQPVATDRSRAWRRNPCRPAGRSHSPRSRSRSETGLDAQASGRVRARAVRLRRPCAAAAVGIHDQQGGAAVHVSGLAAMWFS